MSAIRLLVLGLVRSLKQAHGYRVSQELMAWEADKWANTKTGSIYHALRQLAKDGYLNALPGEDDRDGSRTDYTITREGETAFFAMMERALSIPGSRTDTLSAGLAFISVLSRDKAIALLNRRLETLRMAAADADRVAQDAVFEGENALPSHVEALISFQTSTLHAQINWLEDVLSRIRRGDFIFHGEGASPPAQRHAAQRSAVPA